jgi:hypothetical protein
MPRAPVSVQDRARAEEEEAHDHRMIEYVKQATRSSASAAGAAMSWLETR